MLIYELLREGVFMRYEDFYRQAEKRERKPLHKNEQIAENFLREYLDFTSNSFSCGQSDLMLNIYYMNILR